MFERRGDSPSLYQAVYIVYFIASLVFIISMEAGRVPFGVILKAIPVSSLVVLGWFKFKGVRGRLITAGFFFSVCGDIFLEVDRQGLFLFGLGSFLIGHLFYIGAMLRKPRLNRVSIVNLLILVVYGVFFAIQLKPNLGELTVPVFLYLGVILLMCVSAGLGKLNNPVLLTGAWLFVISDSIIAIDKFLLPISSSSTMIMITYYSGQFLIATGMVKSLEENSISGDFSQRSK